MLEYWEKPCTLWGNTQIWDSFFYEKNENQNVSRLISHDALSKELHVLIKNLQPGTKEIEKANAIQKVSIYE